MRIAEALAKRLGTTIERGYDGPTPPGIDRDNMPNDWTVTLSYENRQMVTPFYGGRMLLDITPEDVLACLLADADIVDTYDDMWEWAEDFGFDPEYEDVDAIWGSLHAEVESLHYLLGDELYRQVLEGDLS